MRLSWLIIDIFRKIREFRLRMSVFCSGLVFFQILHHSAILKSFYELVSYSVVNIDGNRERGTELTNLFSYRLKAYIPYHTRKLYF